MNSIELLKMAFGNLFRRKARSILAIIGVIIGTASIVVMVSIGLGLSKNSMEMIQNNSNLHEIEIYGKQNQNVSGQSDRGSSKIDEKDLKAIKKIPGVTVASMLKQTSIRFIIGKYSGEMSLRSADTEYLDKLDMKMKKGRTLKSGDKFKFIFGKNVPLNLQNISNGSYLHYDPKAEYKDVDLMSNKIYLTKDQEFKKVKKNAQQRFGNEDEKKIKYEVFKGQGIGVLDDENNSYDAFTNPETFEIIQKSNSKAEGAKKNNNFDMGYRIGVYVEDINKIEAISDTLKEQGYQFFSVISMVKDMKKSFALVQGALGGIGAISLLVAAIGITNTMIMSIYERTREIGVMKVIGANIRDIEKLFLCEASAIGFIGGIIGAILSYLISIGINFLYASYAGNMMAGGAQEAAKPILSYIPLWLIVFAILFSTLIGMLSGYIPAKKAMKLSALESLRNE